MGRNSEVCTTKRTHRTYVRLDSFAVSPCKMKRQVFHMGGVGGAHVEFLMDERVSPYFLMHIQMENPNSELSH